MAKKVLWLFLCYVLTNGFGNGLSSEEASEVTETCCTAGETFAVTSSESCDSAPTPEDLEPEQVDTCVLALRSCCLKQNKLKKECTVSFKFAESKRCGVPSSEIGKTCCEECSLGRWTGESQGKESCGEAASVDDYSPTTTLRKNAYYQCCLEAANKPETTTQRRTTTTLKPTTTTPVPTTTTVKPERCDDKNPCEHLCNDEFGRVTCACREGFRLQPDKRTCKDINECAEADDDLCTADGSVCHNTPGAFKCVPLRKRDVGSSCPPGFKKDSVNQVCNDINECQLPRPPCPKYLCVNTIGGFKCSGKSMKPEPEAAPTPPPAGGGEGGAGSGMCPPGFRDGPDDDCADIDECSERLDDCQRLSQHCINTHGSFFCQDHVSKRCAPGFKVDADGVCQDIDECVESSEVCQRNEVCVNLPGAYDCKSKISTLPKLSPKTCQEGMRIRAGGAGCEDIDECREGSHLCDQFQNCINTYGGHECRCKSGFQLDAVAGSCVDIDECAMKLDNCPAGQRCLNVLGTFTCARAAATPPPADYEYYYFDEDNSTNEVAEEKPIPHRPYQRPSTPPTTSTPRPTPTRPTRPTKPPTIVRTTTSTSTTPVPTTTSTTPPPAPIPTRPTTPRTTRPTYNPYGSRPTPTPTTTPPWRPYTNKPTRRPVEEVFIPKPEDDILFEKETDNGTLNMNTGDVPKERWTNVVGKDPEVDDDQVHCLNGFVKDEDGNCVDMDECSTGRYICSNLEVCHNQPGGYSCDCMPGFQRNPSGWCAATPAAPERPTTPRARRITSTTPRASTAVRTTTERTTTVLPPAPDLPPRPWDAAPPSADCGDLGYSFDARLGRCVDIDECASGRASCSAGESCVNTDGGYNCEPEALPDRSTYSRPYERPSYDRPSFVQPRPAPPGSHVITTGTQYGKRGYERLQPTYQRLPDSGALLTSCPWGYKLDDQNMCLDTDECATNVAECGPQQRCDNFPGGYACQCPAGHQLAGRRGCEDVDECTYGNPCFSYSDCINTPGSYRCACHPGFRSSKSNDKICEDEDECEHGLCQQGCTNTWGGYRCTCSRGYLLGADNRTCVDVDECAATGRRRLCAGECVNTPGSYQCGCPAGYRLAEDGRSCVDIDECESGEATCYDDPETVCQNTAGGYHCHKVDCPLGYRLEGKHRCTRIQRSCPLSDQSCLRRPSAYSYHFITFTAGLYLPNGGVDLFTMHGPGWAGAVATFQLRLLRVQPPPAGRAADLSCFDTRPSARACVVSLACALPGPQVAELELGMEVHRERQFAGSVVARLVVIVSRGIV